MLGGERTRTGIITRACPWCLAPKRHIYAPCAVSLGKDLLLNEHI